MIVFLVEHVNQSALLEQSLWVMITIKSMLMNVSHAGLALVYVLLELRKKLNHHKKKRTKLPLSGSFLFVPIRNHYR